jgi:hypothetical protein
MLKYQGVNAARLTLIFVQVFEALNEALPFVERLIKFECELASDPSTFLRSNSAATRSAVAIGRKKGKSLVSFFYYYIFLILPHM